MSYLEYQVKYVPTGLRKLLYLNWPIIFLVTAVCGTGVLMLYSVAGGSMQPWAEPQMQRVGLGLVLMIGVGLVPIWFWRNMALVAYAVSLILLGLVELVGVERNGSQRWLDLGPMDLQPSELMKIALVMLLAAYYDWLPLNKVSRPVGIRLGHGEGEVSLGSVDRSVLDNDVDADAVFRKRLEQAGGLPVLDHRLPEGQRCPNLTRNRRQDHIGLLLVVALSADDDGRPTLAA